MSDTNNISDNIPNERDHPTVHRNMPGSTRRRSHAGDVHLLFGAVEDLLTDLVERGAPEGNIVRIKQIVRTRPSDIGGTATLGITVTARREDEILSSWVVVGRLALDPWGQPMDRTHAHAVAQRHRDMQRLIGALLADAGFDVRLGLYLLPEACYGFAATFGGPGDNGTPATGATGEGRVRDQDRQEGGEHHA